MGNRGMSFRTTYDLFNVKFPIIGMIHLAGGSTDEKVNRALQEMEIYRQEGVTAALIEDYHGLPGDVQRTLQESEELFPGLMCGVNVLRNPLMGLSLAQRYGAQFVQFDSIITPPLNRAGYADARREFFEPFVLGGVRFKYTQPSNNSLESDLLVAQNTCEVIVTTGEGTGKETPISKLREFRGILGEYPFFVGAGVTAENIQAQLKHTDGAIIGSYFKPQGNTHLPVEQSRVRNIMDIVRALR